jgi:hypothetical protein
VRVAAISGIQGNALTLEAVLAEAERKGVDLVVDVGDTISGPWPAEVFERVAAVGAHTLRGNADSEVVERSDRLGPPASRDVVCGQTYMRYKRRLSSGLRVVNQGSIGLPDEGEPGACWALLGPDVELRRSDDDVAATVEQLRAPGAPVDERLVSPLLAPPTSAETTDYFETRRAS